MQQNPFSSLLHSRKFWLGMFDLICSLAIFFVGKYALGALEDVKFVILAIQPIFLLLIGSIAYQNGKAIAGQFSVQEAAAYRARIETQPATQ